MSPLFRSSVAPTGISIRTEPSRMMIVSRISDLHEIGFSDVCWIRQRPA
jgi:hypothetical protein